jgi:rhodanese-related sulfurtransferase
MQSPLKSAAVGALTLILLATVTAVVLQVMRGNTSLLASPEVTDAIRERHFQSFLPVLSAAQLEREMKRGAVVIDARREDDYQRGHIDGAINLPPWSHTETCASALRSFPKGQEIVLYCQSPGCPYAGELGKKLWRLDYTNLYYYRSGWVDWEKRDASTKEGSL